MDDGQGARVVIKVGDLATMSYPQDTQELTREPEYDSSILCNEIDTKALLHAAISSTKPVDRTQKDRQNTKPMGRWQIEEVENERFWREFIDLYREHPALWKVKSASYKNKSVKNACYAKLIEKMRLKDQDATKEDVARKINTFRCSFKRQLRKINEATLAGADINEIPKWTYFEALQFLEDADDEDDINSHDIDLGVEEEAKPMVSYGRTTFGGEVIKNSHGGKTLTLDGFAFYQKEVSKSTLRWGCTQNIAEQCHGTLTTNLTATDIVSTSDHNHEPDHEYIERLKVLASRKFSARTKSILKKKSTKQNRYMMSIKGPNTSGTNNGKRIGSNVRLSNSFKKRPNMEMDSKHNETQSLPQSLPHAYPQQNEHPIYPQQNEHPIDVTARSWAHEFWELTPDQQIYARKAINDILFEGRLETLNRHSVKINENGNGQLRSSVPISSQSPESSCIETIVATPDVHLCKNNCNIHCNKTYFAKN
ncbi:unnamed protein product [Meganyctiphanes norvegica]|uniref:MADF domain-containing protein n=1 Tax=Meganyctiphanes norvegica TaxID=48144 RepID=A0AAV2PLX7_MEGNR